MAVNPVIISGIAIPVHQINSLRVANQTKTEIKGKRNENTQNGPRAGNLDQTKLIIHIEKGNEAKKPTDT